MIFNGRYTEDIKLFHQHRRVNKKGQPRDDFVAACYSVYKDGKSIRYIATKAKITHQVLFDMFKARGYRLRTKKKLPEKIYKGVNFRPDPTGTYRSLDRTKPNIYLHRMIWEEARGPIPKDHYVVFKDGRKDNIVLENLECLPAGEAKKRYNNANQFGYRKHPGKGSWGL